MRFEKLASIIYLSEVPCADRGREIWNLRNSVISHIAGGPLKLTRKEKKDIQMLIRFVCVFCREKHRKHEKTPFSVPFEEAAPLIENGTVLCEACSELLAYGIRKRFRCTHDTKPMCKKCETQC